MQPFTETIHGSACLPLGEVFPMIASPQRIQLTPEQYLAWEAEQPYKHEYLNGEAYAMTGEPWPIMPLA